VNRADCFAALAALLAACPAEKPAPVAGYERQMAAWVPPEVGPGDVCHRVRYGAKSFAFTQKSRAIGKEWTVSGTFAPKKIEAFLPSDPSRARVNVVLDAASIDTGDTGRDTHLRDWDFFDTHKHPTIGFTSTSIRFEDRRAMLEGDFTMMGKTAHQGPIALHSDVPLAERTTAPITVTGSIAIERARFAMTATRTFSGNASRFVIDIEPGTRVDLSLRLEPVPCGSAN
jgi:polyisoprenoid-binding protein YceI